MSTNTDKAKSKTPRAPRKPTVSIGDHQEHITLAELESALMEGTGINRAQALRAVLTILAKKSNDSEVHWRPGEQQNLRDHLEAFVLAGMKLVGTMSGDISDLTTCSLYVALPSTRFPACIYPLLGLSDRGEEGIDGTEAQVRRACADIFLRELERQLHDRGIDRKALIKAINSAQA